MIRNFNLLQFLLFLKGTLDLSSDSSFPITQVYPVFTMLIKHIKDGKTNENLNFFMSGLIKMELKIEEYWNLIEEDCIISMVFDPRSKLDLIQSNEKKKC